METKPDAPESPVCELPFLNNMDSPGNPHLSPLWCTCLLGSLLHAQSSDVASYSTQGKGHHSPSRVKHPLWPGNSRASIHNSEGRGVQPKSQLLLLIHPQACGHACIATTAAPPPPPPPTHTHMSKTPFSFAVIPMPPRWGFQDMCSLWGNSTANSWPTPGHSLIVPSR